MHTQVHIYVHANSHARTNTQTVHTQIHMLTHLHGHKATQTCTHKNKGTPTHIHIHVAPIKHSCEIQFITHAHKYLSNLGMGVHTKHTSSCANTQMHTHAVYCAFIHAFPSSWRILSPQWNYLNPIHISRLM
jgi:hypothetical protein